MEGRTRGRGREREGGMGKEGETGSWALVVGGIDDPDDENKLKAANQKPHVSVQQVQEA